MATIKLQNRLSALIDEIAREKDQADGAYPVYLYEMMAEASQLAEQLRRIEV